MDSGSSEEYGINEDDNSSVWTTFLLSYWSETSCTHSMLPFELFLFYVMVHGGLKLLNDSLLKHTLSFKQKSPMLLSLHSVVYDIIPY